MLKKIRLTCLCAVFTGFVILNIILSSFYLLSVTEDNRPRERHFVYDLLKNRQAEFILQRQPANDNTLLNWTLADFLGTDEKSSAQDLSGTCSRNNCPAVREDMLNVHIVAHSHDDVGWKKTYMQYYNGRLPRYDESRYQGSECTRCILTNVISELLQNPSRRFIFVEIAFFSLWYEEQDDIIKGYVKQLIRERRLELVGGGWCMSDSATTYYDDVIDQHTHGFQWIMKEFGECAMPKSAWHVDQFGHSREHSSIFAQMGYDGLLVGRIDNYDQERRESTRNMETIWKTSPDNLGDRLSLFTSVLYDGYFTPRGLGGRPVISDSYMKEYVKIFLKAIQDRARSYKTNHILIPFGGDFGFQRRGEYSFIDRLIQDTNKMRQEGMYVNVFYSTPTCYLNSVNNEKRRYETMKSDFFPYGIIPNTYWTGFYTSRPGLKRHVKVASSLLQSCKILAVMADSPELISDINQLKEAVGILQHHDAITGTEQQHVTNDYNLILSKGTEACQNAMTDAYHKLMTNRGRVVPHTFCPSLNISVCLATELNEKFTVIIFNPHGRNWQYWVRLPVTASMFVVKGPDNQEITNQMVPLPKSTLRIPERSFSKATSEVVFPVQLAPVSFSVYTVEREGTPVTARMDIKEYSDTTDLEIRNQFLSLTIDGRTGLTKTLKNLQRGIEVSFQHGYFYYLGSKGGRRIPGDRRGGMGGFFGGHKRASGAYAFVPKENTPPIPVELAGERKVTVHVVKGPNVKEVHQTFSPWVSHVIRLYDNASHLEVQWTVGPIPDEDKETKEVVSRFSTNMRTNNTWYTDSNGREMIKRRLNIREPVQFNVTCPISGNYYPVTSRIFIKDESTNVQLTVLTDRSQGGSSLQDGEMELLVHRRTFHDDDLGVDEPLDERGSDGKGLIIRGTHYILLDDIGHAPQNYRTLGLYIHRWPTLSFRASPLPDGIHKKGVFLKKELPHNIHLLTLDLLQNDHSTILLRLENFFEKSEDSQIAIFTLDDYFHEIKSVRELSLGANHNITDVKRLQWIPNDDAITPVSIGTSTSKHVHTAPYTISLAPMEIRTFHIKTGKTMARG